MKIITTICIVGLIIAMFIVAPSITNDLFSGCGKVWNDLGKVTDTIKENKVVIPKPGE